MSKDEAAAIDRKVLEAVRKAPRPEEPGVLVTRLKKNLEDLDELEIRESIWRLIAQNVVELSDKRKLTVPDSQGKFVRQLAVR